jgi:hypothetical protein
MTDNSGMIKQSASHLDSASQLVCNLSRILENGRRQWQRNQSHLPSLATSLGESSCITSVAYSYIKYRATTLVVVVLGGGGGSGESIVFLNWSGCCTGGIKIYSDTRYGSNILPDQQKE